MIERAVLLLYVFVWTVEILPMIILSSEMAADNVGFQLHNMDTVVI